MSMEDVAQNIELREWERNNLKTRPEKARFEPGETGYGPAECVECETEMPIERREWGFDVCVDCKALTELPRRR